VKIPANVVGCRIGPIEQEVDKRWLMAYSAGLGETAWPHPLFPVCYEWPATTGLRERAGLQPLNAQLVHAQHDLTIHRPLAPGKLSISGEVIAARERRPGVTVVFRLSTRDVRGEAVTTTDFTVLYRGTQLQGEARGEAADPPAHTVPLVPAGEVPVAATAAHVYTECARIWNPIHTDPDYARAAGLPGIILHGTATLALSVSKILSRFNCDYRSVKRVQCRFSGMVLMPGMLEVRGARQDGTLLFETRNADGKTVIERGSVTLETHAA